MARQAELEELRKEIEDLKKNNPITEMANGRSVFGAILSPSAPLEGACQTPPETTAPVEGQIELRSGEFAVTDKAGPASFSEAAAP
jgi:hypothetical protein